MTQEEKWLVRYNEVVAFIEREHRNPSGLLKEDRIEAFDKLMALMEQYKRKNQYE